MGAPLAVALGALHYLALFLQLGGATRPAGHAPWDNHVSGHGECGRRPRGLPQQTPPELRRSNLAVPGLEPGLVAGVPGRPLPGPWTRPGSLAIPAEEGVPRAHPGSRYRGESPPPPTPTLTDTRTPTATQTLRATLTAFSHSQLPSHISRHLRPSSSLMSTHTYAC